MSLPVVLALLAAQTGCGAASAAAAPTSVAARAPGMPSTPSAEMAPAPAAAPMSPAPVSAFPAPGGGPSAMASPAAPAAPGVAKASPAATARPADTRSAKNAGPTARAPVIIYQGDLRMVADEEAIPKTIDRIIDVAEGVGGHIAARQDLSVSIKVPSASFREAMTKIESIGGVVGRSVKADDVSEEFHDLEVQLGNLRATRARLQEFLGRASGIPDMLTVERELERVSQEIDRIEGRLEFLRTRAAMSVIAVQLAAKPKIAPIVAATPPPPPPPRSGVDLPSAWVSEIGIDPLLDLTRARRP